MPAAMAFAQNDLGPDAVAERLELARQALGLTQTQLCEQSGIGTSTYNQWKQGKQRPQLEEAVKLYHTFGITFDWIYRGDPSGLPHRIASKLGQRAAE